jgi:hypothetical protein
MPELTKDLQWNIEMDVKEDEELKQLEKSFNVNNGSK